MKWFEFCFPLTMILLPAVIASIYTSAAKKPLAKPEKTRPGLFAWTLVVAVMFLILYGLRVSGTWNPETSLPFVVNLGRPLDQWFWLAWFPLWFALAMPMIARTKPGGDSTVDGSREDGIEGDRALPGGSPVRTASLESRANKPLLGPVAKLVPPVVWMVGLVACLVALDVRGIPAGRSRAQHLWFPIFALTMSLLPVCLVWGIQRVQAEAEPLDPSGSKEVREAYRNLKQAKARGLYGFHLALEISLILCALSFLGGVFAGRSLGPQIGILGSSLGTALGIAGGVFGTRMTLRALRIRRRVEELSRKTPEPR